MGGSAVRISANDAYGNVNASWTGAVTLTSGAFTGSVPATISANGYVDGVSFTPTVAGSGMTVSAAATQAALSRSSS